MNTQDEYSFIDELFYDSVDIKTEIIKRFERVKKEANTKVDRLEVIDDTGRAYVKGSIYGTPVSIELSYQDDGRTLKVFVSKRTEEQK